jgi:hypothetical protein
MRKAAAPVIKPDFRRLFGCLHDRIPDSLSDSCMHPRIGERLARSRRGHDNTIGARTRSDFSHARSLISEPRSNHSRPLPIRNEIIGLDDHAAGMFGIEGLHVINTAQAFRRQDRPGVPVRHN